MSKGMTGSTATEFDQFWNDPRNWSGLGVYRCEADPRLVVPKQKPMMGWTVNFARPGAKPLLFSIIALGVLPMIAALLYAPRDPEAWIAATAGGGFGVLALTLGLNRKARGKSFFPSWGAMSEETRRMLEQEGVELIDDVRGAVHFRNFRAPGKRYSWRRSGFSGTIVLTGRRFAVFTGSRSVIDVPLADLQFAQLECSLRNDQTLSIRFDPARFDPEHSGSVEVRVRTPLARTFLERLNALSS